MTEAERASSALTTGFDPTATGFFDNPYPQYAAARTAANVQRSPTGQYIVFDYSTAAPLLRDPTLSVDERRADRSGAGRMERAKEIDPGWSDRARASMLDLDPPDHTRLRRLVSKAFTPRRVSAMEASIHELVTSLLDRARAEGTMDLISDFAFPLPFAVISDLLGIDATARDQVRDWSHTIVTNFEPFLTEEQTRSVIDAAEQLRRHLASIIAQKRTHPGEDLLSALIAAEDNGDVLDDDELIAQVLLLYVAGHETTVNLIGNGVHALLENPDELARWRADPSLDVTAIEELLRFDSPVQFTRRVVLDDRRVGDLSVPAGSLVMLCLGAANRDPACFIDPDRLDLARVDAGRHLSFGGGVHHCLGAQLARAEARIAITELIRSFPNLGPAAVPVHNRRLVLRGYESIPLRLT